MILKSLRNDVLLKHGGLWSEEAELALRDRRRARSEAYRSRSEAHCLAYMSVGSGGQGSMAPPGFSYIVQI